MAWWVEDGSRSRLDYVHNSRGEKVHYKHRSLIGPFRCYFDAMCEVCNLDPQEEHIIWEFD